MKLGSALLVSALIICAFAVLSFCKQGEVVDRMVGSVERCERLGGAAESLFHATIKADSGSYIIAKLPGCEVGAEVTILVKRGALFFNTVFAAQPK